MVNRLRFRSGQVELRKVRVDASSVIEAGDLVYLDGDDAKPASALTWDTNLATTQAAFAAVFLGVAHQSSDEGESSPISVDVSATSVYEFDVASGTYEVGAVLGPDASGTALMSGQLEGVVSRDLGIARSVEYRGSGATKLRVQFSSAFHTGSSNVNAGLG